MLELMILYLLIKRDLTMYSIQKHIKENFGAYTCPSFGAIKPALVRLEKQNFITSSKIMSEGGKLSIYYSITNDGTKAIATMLLQPISPNPLQFLSDARIKLSCLSVLESDERYNVFEDIKANAQLHKANAENILNNEYTDLNFYQKIVLDNAICEYKNFITLIENLEKENGRNSK